MFRFLVTYDYILPVKHGCVHYFADFSYLSKCMEHMLHSVQWWTPKWKWLPHFENPFLNWFYLCVLIDLRAIDFCIEYFIIDDKINRTMTPAKRQRNACYGGHQILPLISSTPNLLLVVDFESNFSLCIHYSGSSSN